jgi:hypothetical protein
MADLIPPRRSDILTNSGIPTLRHAEFLESLVTKTNNNVDSVGANINGSSVRAQLLTLQEQVGSGDFLTWDDDGFSWDSDHFTFDQDEA